MTTPATTTFSRDAVRRIDRLAIDKYGIPGIVLMENAARGLAGIALDMLRARDDHAADAAAAKRVLGIAGGGNNAGDAFAAARHLHNAGHRVTTLLTRPMRGYTGDAATNLTIIARMGLEIIEAHDDPVAALGKLPPHDLVLDGLLGTGLTSAVRPPLDAVIARINDAPAPVLAIDLPSGLDCDSGRPLGVAVRAERTATFVGIKLGFTHPGAAEYTGRVHVVDIGVPRELLADPA